MKKILLSLSLIFSLQLFAVSVTVTKTAEQLGTAYSWSTGSFYGSFPLDNIVTVAANQPDSGSINGYYSPDSPRDWRMYQARNNGEFSVSVRPGYIIHSLSFVYSNKNNGVLSLVPGKSLEKQYQVASGQTLQVDTSSITFYAGNTGTSGSGQVRISQFTVTYYSTDTAALIEQFTQVSQTTNNDDVRTWQGDVFDWQVLHGRRAAKDTLNGGVQGTWLKGDGYLRSVNAEGGIKRLSFSWRQFVTVETELVLALSAGEVWNDTARIQSIAAQALSKDYRYDSLIQCKQNVQLSFTNLSQIENNDRFLLGDFYITPYIYIAPEARSLSLQQKEGTFDLRSILQDNTDGEGEIVYSILSDETHGATIFDGVVDFSQSAQSGNIQVQVSWNDSSVVLSPVVLSISVPEVQGEAFTETFSHCTKTSFSGTTFVVGDQGVFGWNFTHFARQNEDSIADHQGTRIGYNGGIAMNGIQEGGIQSIRFDWRARSVSQPVHFVVSVDGNPYNVKYTSAQLSDTSYTYSAAFNIDHNTAMSVTMGAKESTPQSEIVVGPISIIPYLLFRTKRDTVVLEDTTMYNLDTMLINNTKESVVYTLLLDETGAASIHDGVLDLSAVTQNGMVTVQTSWHSVSTTISIYALYAATDLKSHFTDSPTFTKILKDGQLLILRDNDQYDLMGNKR